MKNALNKAYSFLKEGLCSNCSNRDKNILKNKRSQYGESNKWESILNKKLFRAKEASQRNISKNPEIEIELKENPGELLSLNQESLFIEPLDNNNCKNNEKLENNLNNKIHKPKEEEMPVNETFPVIRKRKIRKCKKILKETSQIRKQKGTPWKSYEDQMLIEAVKMNNFKNWKEISKMVPGRSSTQCSQRWRRIQPYKSREPWTKEEDKILLEFVKNYGKNWSLIASNLEGRTGKQVRERFLNCLDPEINRQKFSEEEDETIIEFYMKYGPKWKKFSSVLVGRTENMVKNRFYSYLKRKYNISETDPVNFANLNEMDIEERESSILTKVTTGNQENYCDNQKLNKTIKNELMEEIQGLEDPFQNNEFSPSKLWITQVEDQKKNKIDYD